MSYGTQLGIYVFFFFFFFFFGGGGVGVGVDIHPRREGLDGGGSGIHYLLKI